MAKAIVIEQTGEPSVMQYKEVATRNPEKGQVRVKTAAIGVNFIDIYQRTGLYPVPLPFTPGGEFCGVVDALGKGVKAFKVGDRVACGTAGTGCYAEEVVLDASRLVKVPPGISDEVAAAMMLKGMTVQYLIRQIYRVKKGDTLLVHAAAGGVGLILCQWAKHLGAKVIGTVSSPEKAKLAKAHGCTWTIDYTKEDFVARVKEITKGKLVPVVYDSIGKDTFPASLDCLQKRGLFVTYGNASGPVPAFPPALLAQKGSLMMTRPTLFTFVSTADELKKVAGDLMRVVKSGAVKIEVNHRYKLRDAGKAHSDLAARKTTGSIVLLP